jgi:hypothetical protein
MQHNLSPDPIELQAMIAEEGGTQVSKVSPSTSPSRVKCSCFSLVEIDQSSEVFRREMSSGLCSVRFHHGMALSSGRNESSVLFEWQ